MNIVKIGSPVVLVVNALVIGIANYVTSVVVTLNSVSTPFLFIRI